MNKERDEKLLKSWLKRKITITTSTVVAFLITGMVGATVVYGAVNIENTNGNTISNGSANGPGVSIGGNAKTQSGSDVSIGESAGKDSNSTGNSVAIGKNSRVGDQTVNQSIAIGGGNDPGQGAWAKGDQSIAIGGNTRSEGHSSIAIGGDDLDNVAKQVIGYVNAKDEQASGSIQDAMKNLTGVDILNPQYSNTMSGHGAVAVGVKAVAGHLSLALGTAANAGATGYENAITYKAVNTVAIGSGASAMLDNAIAIGGGAKADESNKGKKQTGATIKSIEYKWKGGDKIAAGDIVSFGAKGFERQLKNIAPGEVSEESTDGINGSQLYGIAKNITSENHLKFLGDDGQNDATKVINLSLEKNRLNIVGGADTTKLSDKNIGVVYESGYNKDADGKDLETDNPAYQEGKLKIKLSKELKNLKSAEFKTDTGDETVINGDGVTITPVANGKKPVSVTKNGLNNGGNVIADVAGNLEGAKPNSTGPTTNATVPNNVDSIKNNAATVGDVLNAGWNLQNNSEEKDFVKPYDTVNFADGNGTTAVVDTEADSSTSKIKYNVNLGNGLGKDAATNKITVKTADESLTVGADGVKAKTDNKTITTGDSGLEVVTGKIESGTTPGTMKVKDGDAGKIATVDSVVKAVNSAAFTLKASSTTGGTRNGSSTVEANGEAIKAGSTIEMIAGKNLDVKHDENGKITFATVENPSFKTVQVGGDQGPKFSKTSDGNIKVSDKDGENPVKITNVKDGAVNENSKDAINGSQFHKLANNTIKLAGKNGSDAATETDAQNLNQQDGIKFTVKSSDGKLLEVTAGGDTITLTPKTGTITTTNGVPTANTTNGKLVTADQIVNALTEMGWKATADKDGTGTVTGTASELIKAGETVTFKAGDNLAIKQDGKNFIYSLNTALSGLTSAEFKDGNKNKVNITPTGITITKPADTVNNQPEKTVTLNQDGLNNGGNLITNVASNLDGAKTGTIESTTKATAPTNVGDIKNNAATVGDVLNAGWNLQGNNKDVDFVKPYDTVNFINGDGTTATVETTNNKVSTVKYSVNLGDGLKKDDTGNTISIKPADKSLEVNKDGLKVKTDNTTITTGGSGLKVVTGTIESVTTGDKSGTVKVKDNDAGKIATVDSVVNAINSAAWKATSGVEGTGTTATSGHTKSDEEIKAGDTVTFKAGDNLIIKQAGKDFTYSLAKELKDLSKVEVKDTSGNSVVTTPTGTTTTDGTNTTTVGPTGTTTKDKDGNETKVTKDGVTITPGKDDPANPGTKIPDTDKAVSLTKDGLNNGGNKITNVTSGLDKITTGPAKDLVDLSKPTGGSTPKVSDNTAATVGDLRNMGWVVSSDKTTDNLGTAYSEAVKNANEVKFVGKGAATVSGKTVDGVRTVTVDVTVPDVEKGTIEPDTGDNKGKVKSKAGDGDKFTTVDTVVNAINSAAWKATSGVEGTGTTATSGHTKSDEEIKAGDTVTFKAGDNLIIKQSRKEFTYSLNPELTNLSKVEVKDTAGNSVVTTPTGTTITAKDATDPTKDITTVINAGGTTVTDKDGNTTKVDGNGITITPKNDPANPVKLTKDGLNNGGNAITNVAGNLEGAKKDTNSPTNKADAPTNVDDIKNNAATVGDVLNAGWNLQNNGTEKDFVKPYDTVNFVNGGNTVAEVTTDKDGKVSNVTYNVTGLPLTYTNEAGKPVSKVGDKYYEVDPATGKPDMTKEVQPGDLKTTLVNPNPANAKTGTTDPSTLNNVKSGLDTYKAAPNNQATVNDPKNGLVDLSKPNDGSAPKVSDNTAATVGDLRNMGWVISSDKTTGNLGTGYNDQVKNANEVKFVGKNGIQVSGKTDDKGVKTLTFEMEAGEVTPTEITKADGTNETKLVKVGDKVYNPEDIGTDGKPKQGKAPVGTIAKDGKVYNSGDVVNGVPNNGANPIDGITVTPNNGSKFVTGNQVADAIEKSGFVVGKNNKALSAADFKNEDEKVNPNDELRFADGDNTNVKLATKEVLDASGKVKTVTTVKVDVVDLPVKYTDADGNIVKKGEDGKYYNPKDLDEKVYDPATKTYKNADGSALAEQPTPKAKDSIVSSLVNPNDAKDGKVGTPSTLTNVANGAKTFDPAKDADGNDLKLGNDGKWYPADSVLIDNKYYPAGSVKNADGTITQAGNTTPVTEVKPVATPVNPGKAGLVNFSKSNPTNAATVGDLQNMGWVVGTPDNKYNDQVRNANKVDFKGGNGIEVTGKTTADGTREITVGIKEGTVTNNVKVTKEDGTVIEAIRDKDGKLYEKDANGKVDKTKPVVTTDKDKVENNGSGFVTGNAVATAIGESGWNVGKANTKDVTKAFETEAKLHDKVNPNDDVKFVDGDNTTVSMVTIDSQNDDGTKKATTYIKTDINKDIHIDSVTVGGKNADGTPGKDGALTVKDKNGNDRVKVDPNGMTITPNKADGTPDPDKAVSLTNNGLNNGGNNITNVKSNLPQVNDGAKKAYDVNGNPIANKNNTAAPITAVEAADIVKKAGNNAATVGDVLNAGWNLQENGSDRDFVKPYDTVNFVDGTNTKVTVKTNEDGTKSNVQINLVGLPIAFADKDGNRVVQGVKDGKIVYHKMLSDGTASKELVDPKNVQVTNVNPTDAKINTVGTPGATINNVAPAEVSPTSTQAVNGSQLYQVAQEINNVNNKVDKLGDRVNKGLAGAAAMSGIEFMEIGINQATVAAAVGGYRGTHAVAVGVQAAPTENTRVNAKMSLTPGSRTEAMYSVGAAYRFNLK